MQSEQADVETRSRDMMGIALVRSGKRALSFAIAAGFGVAAMACSSAGGRPAEATQPPAAAGQANAPAAAAVTNPRYKFAMVTHGDPRDLPDFAGCEPGRHQAR